MSERLVVHSQGKPIYNILVERSFDTLLTEFEKLNIKNRRVCIVTDSNVAKFYLDELKNMLQGKSVSLISYVFEAGETNKNLDIIKEIYRTLIKARFDRKDLLIALGGGVVGDMTGFAAATYLRGIDFIQIPTTLLSQVDSSIGGKTGVDFDEYKNMVGAFYMPKLVYINLKVLKTLTQRDYFSGMGEVIKHGLIKDKSYYNWITSHISEIKNRDIRTMGKMVFVSCKIKRGVVENDPTEKGERALLNFGHTLGHAVEKLMDFNLLHGECVALGCVGAAYISYKKGAITLDEVNNIKDTFEQFNLLSDIKKLNGKDIISVTKSDKKMEGDTIKFILLNSIGNAYINRNVQEAEMEDAIKYIANLDCTDSVRVEK